MPLEHRRGRRGGGRHPDRPLRPARVACGGGPLAVEWPKGGRVRQVGEVELIFEGHWLAG